MRLNDKTPGTGREPDNGPARLRGVALDVDGTLLRSDHRLSPLALDVCRRLSAQGIWTTLVSARPPKSVLDIAVELGSPGPWVALNGALVFAADRTILSRRSLPPAVLRSVLARYRGRSDVSVNVYSGFDWLVLRHDLQVEAEARIVGFAPSVMAADEMRVVDKLLLVVAPGQEGCVLTDLNRFDGDIRASISKACYVEVTAGGVDKGSALRIAANSVGLELPELFVAGDGANDMPMLLLGGFAAVMGHSPRSAKEIARIVVGSNDDDSLFHLIQAVFAIDTSLA